MVRRTSCIVFAPRIQKTHKTTTAVAPMILVDSRLSWICRKSSATAKMKGRKKVSKR